VTLDDIKAMTEDWITPAVAASAMKMDPGRLIEYARKDELPFAVRISGSRVLISRKSFLKAYGALEEEKEEDRTLEQILQELKRSNARIETLCLFCEVLVHHIAPEKYKMLMDSVMDSVNKDKEAMQ